MPRSRKALHSLSERSLKATDRARAEAIPRANDFRLDHGGLGAALEWEAPERSGGSDARRAAEGSETRLGEGWSLVAREGNGARGMV